MLDCMSMSSFGNSVTYFPSAWSTQHKGTTRLTLLDHSHIIHKVLSAKHAMYPTFGYPQLREDFLRLVHTFLDDLGDFDEWKLGE